MDMGSIVSWIQAILWLVAALLWIGKIVRGEATMHPWLRWMLSSNGLIATVIVLGLVMSGISLRMNYQNAEEFKPPRLMLPMDYEKISDKSFTNETVEIDGKDFENCTFENVKLVFHGRKTSIINHNTFLGGIVLSTDRHNVAAFAEMLAVFGAFSSDVLYSSDGQEFRLKKVFPPSPTPTPIPK